MSSYLSIYIVPKRKKETEKKQYQLITSYSRNTEMYQVFYENVNPVFIGVEGRKDAKYTKIEPHHIQDIKQSLDSEIANLTASITEYEKYAAKNPEYIQEIINDKTYLKEREALKNKVSFLEDILDDISYETSDIEGMYCNVD